MIETAIAMDDVELVFSETKQLAVSPMLMDIGNAVDHAVEGIA